MPELTATLKAMYEVEARKNKFAAAMQGVDLDQNGSSDSSDAPVTFQEIQARAVEKMTGDQSASRAVEYGFIAEEGTGYQLLGEI